MYAVIESGGKQFRVELGSEIEVERVNAEPGETVEFEQVLLVADADEASIGRPLVDGARVSATVVRRDRTAKVTVFKYRPKARRRVKHGHRQDFTLLRVLDIVLGEKSAARQAEDTRRERDQSRAAAEEQAARQAAADQALAERLAREADSEKATDDAESAAGSATRGGPRRRRRGASGSVEVETERVPTESAGPERAGTETPRGRQRPPRTQASGPDEKPRGGRTRKKDE
ncbi:MAG: 50S ribosomal protein L21 [Chloroflexota bacterium]|nr:50S ribosomal protein L21 [Chloroflexota bacterium]